MKRAAVAIPILLLLTGCDFTDGVIYGVIHHVTLETEFYIPLKSYTGTEDYCEFFDIFPTYYSYYSEFQLGAWWYLMSVLQEVD